MRIRLSARARKGTPQTALLPFVRDLVPVVDRTRRLMKITPPPGWIIDAASVRESLNSTDMESLDSTDLDSLDSTDLDLDVELTS